MNRPQKREQQPGRNEPCSCGSSKKYKQCCLRRNEESAKAQSNDEVSLSQALQTAISHHQAGRRQQAEAIYRQILQVNPEQADALHLSGVVAYQKGELDSAVELIEKALSLSPSEGVYYGNLGIVFRAQGKLGASVECNQKALSIKPDSAEMHFNLGVAYEKQDRWDAATECYRKALLIKPGYADACMNLGNALMVQGKQQQALALLEKGLAFNPSYGQIYSNLIFAVSRAIEDDGAKVFELSKKFGKQFETGLDHKLHRNDAVPDRRIRIGYVSGDFFRHSVAFFIAPILASHDKRNVETFCYYNHHQVDHVTQQLMGCADHWRSIFGVSDEDAAQLIRQDAIDILVDLSGHTARNRLLLFARKPAPVQVTWFGYPASTGLSAMDYRLTNRYIDPHGWNEQYHTESLVRLSASTCFQPEKNLPEISLLPAMKNGYLTFASFHTANKITPITISLWAKVLSDLPDARLVLCPDTAKDQLVRQFQALGISTGRLDFFAERPLLQYLALHNQVDVMLDTFPYNGGTVSRHALWMGVPVLTLAGRQAVSRTGLSLMSTLGLESFVAECEADFVDNARRWASDFEGLAQIRNTLRGKMQNAPFSKPALVVNGLETAYRQMWCNWCEQSKTAS